MNMEYFGLIVGSGGLLGVIGLFFYMGKWFGKFEGRLESIDNKFLIIHKSLDGIEKKFESIMSEIKEMRQDIRALTSRLDRLEVRVEERTLKVIKFQKHYTENEEIEEN